MSSQSNNHDQASVRILAERLRLAERVGKVGIWEWEIPSNRLTWTDEVYRIHGKDAATYTPEYESWQAILHPEDRAHVVAAIGETMKTGREYYVEFRVQWPDGSIRWITTRGGVELDPEGRPTRMIGLTFDITDRKLAEEALLRKEQELRIITDALPVLIAYVDGQGRYRFMSKAYEVMFERPREEMAGKHVREVVGPAHFQQLEPYFSRALAGEEVFFLTEMQGSGQRSYLLQVSYIPDRDSSGQAKGFFAMVQDVTAQRRAESALRKAEKLAAAGRLAATIAHELNNPLEAITNLVFLATEDPEAPPQIRQYLAMAEQELRRVHHLVNQTLGFYRDLSRPTEVNFQKLVENVISIHAQKIQSRGARVQSRVDPETTVRGLAGELTQVFSNLLSNALDAIAHGGTVQLHVRRGRRAVRLCVADNGSGIPQQDRARLFEPFFTTKVDVGTGLGLWVTKGIVEKHDGAIRFRSRSQGPYQGTLFVITLSTVSAEMAPESAEGKTAATF